MWLIKLKNEVVSRHWHNLTKDAIKRLMQLKLLLNLL